MTYEELKKEVMKIHDVIKEIAQEDEKIDSLWGGTQILYSPIETKDKSKPTILLLGFNPGIGYLLENDKIAADFEPLEQLDYIEKDYKYAKSIRSFFLDICKEKELFENNVVATNFYFFSAKNLKETKELINLLKEKEPLKKVAQEILHSSKEGNYLYCLAKRWLKALIEEIVKPDVIITIGKETHDFIENTLKNEDCKFKINFNKENILVLPRKYSDLEKDKAAIVCKQLKEKLNK
jgi:hypothetical protein